MENRLILSDKLAEILVIFGRKIEILSANNELSWNKHAENIIIPLLNLIFDANFSNANIEVNKQIAAVDLWDKKKKIVFQITSDDSYSKIKTTISKFVETKLYENFETLNFLFLKEKGKRTLTSTQENELTQIINTRFVFNSNENLFDFAKLHNLTLALDKDEVENVYFQIENELGSISEELFEKGPVATLIFDDAELELASKITKGLTELGIRIRHYSSQLDYLQKKNNEDSAHCQLLYDLSLESKNVIILGSITLREKVRSGQIDENILKVLENQHNSQFLFKLDESVTFNDIPSFKPKVLIANRNKFQYIIDSSSIELRKQNKISEIKGYDDFETIIRLYENKANILSPVKYSNTKKKIGYTLLEAVDKLKSTKTYYLYLYKGILLKNTAEHFYRENKLIRNNSRNLIVFLSKESSQKLLNERIVNAKKAFKSMDAFYLDEFVWEHCTNDVHKVHEVIRYSPTKNFIIPELKSIEGSLTEFDQIENWLVSEHDPILVITGGGGIGKTTMAKVIADKFQEVRTNSRVIFIEASDAGIMNQLLRFSENQQIDLYDFYSAAYSSESISRDLFRINIDNGNFLLIIDGLDEVFSRIPDFNVRHFIASVSNDFVKDLGIGKILLTCRRYFWKDKVSQDTHINHVEIEPFSRKHANQFFQLKFSNNEKLVKKSMDIVESLNPATSDEKDKIMPYIVDVVGKIVESGDELLDESNETVQFLNLTLKNDYVTYRILIREHMKTGQLTTNQQCEFFIFFSVFYGGRILSSELQNLWASHFDTTLTSAMQEALKSHPLLEELNGNLMFKYDFFEIFFKSLYLSELISIDSIEIPNNSFMKILLSEGKFGSSLFYETSNRMYKAWNEENLLRVSVLMEYFRNEYKNYEGFNTRSTNQVISALFALALMINQIKVGSQTGSNTELLKHLFGNNKNEIVGLSIVNFSEIQGNLKFNFTDLKFIDCYFDSYDSFWDCTFKDTHFENCSFFNMPSYSNSNSKDINFQSFVNSRKDLTFDEYFESLNNNKTGKSESLKLLLEKFFKFFYSNGYLQTQRASVIKKKYNPKWNNLISLDELLRKLSSLNVLENEFSRVAKENVITIRENYKEDILQFSKEGTMSVIIKSAIESIVK